MKLLTFGTIIVILGLSIALNSCSNNNTVTNPPTSGGTLSLSLDTLLDGGGNIVVPNAIVKAVLYKFSAPTTIVKTATVASGVASFDMTGLSNGDYFMVVNDSSAHWVPTYITDYTKSYNQKVGKKLRLSTLLSSTGDSLFKLKTYTFAQGEHEIIKYSNNQGTGKYSYALLNYSTKKAETRYLDNASTLVSQDCGVSPHSQVSWAIGKTNHGKGPDGDSLQTQALCGACHTNWMNKPTQWSQITPTNGWCFKCHNDYHGDPNGFFDPTQ